MKDTGTAQPRNVPGDWVTDGVGEGGMKLGEPDCVTVGDALALAVTLADDVGVNVALYVCEKVGVEEGELLAQGVWDVVAVNEPDCVGVGEGEPDAEAVTVGVADHVAEKEGEAVQVGVRLPLPVREGVTGGVGVRVKEMVGLRDGVREMVGEEEGPHVCRFTPWRDTHTPLSDAHVLALMATPAT